MSILSRSPDLAPASGRGFSRLTADVDAYGAGRSAAAVPPEWNCSELPVLSGLADRRSRPCAERVRTIAPAFVAAFAASLSFAACGDGAGPQLGAIPTNALYAVQIQGRADFNGQPGQSWVLPGSVVLLPTEDPGAATRNGRNPIEVGIFTQASPVVGVAGALYYATNTALTALVGGSIGSSLLDLAFVDVNAGARTIRVQVDGDAFGQPNARLGTLNIYNLTSGIAAQVHHVLAGQIEIQLSADGQQIAGTIALGGSSGFGGPNVTSGYLAQFSGSRVQ